MKKLTTVILFIVGAILLIGVYSVNADPHFRCDPDPNGITDSYVITSESGDEIVTPYPLNYDLVDVPDGTYTIQVRARNATGDSANVVFTFTLPIAPPLPVPGPPTNLRIE